MTRWITPKERMIASRALPVVTLTLLASIAACSSTSGDVGSSENTGTARAAVINGKPSDASQDAVVLIMHYDPTGGSGGVGQCTGTLLAPRLVLTARHCVSDTDPYAACKADGTPLAAGAVRGNHDPETMYIFTGETRPKIRSTKDIKPAGIGKKILDDGSKNLCNHDIALIVLEEPIEGVPIAPIRLDGDVTKGELITAVGWGVTEETTQPGQRQQRTNVKVTNVGPDKAVPAVPPNEFEVGEAICSGDSGGPAIAQETNAVVGVVSRGGNPEASKSSDPATKCIDGANLYTKISPFKDLIMKGYELAEAEPWLEGGPDPRKLKPGSACRGADECRSNLCLSDPTTSASTCAEDCSETETCSVEGQICTAEGDAKVCRAPVKTVSTVTTTTCSATPAVGAGRGTPALLMGLVAIAGLRRKRR